MLGGLLTSTLLNGFIIPIMYMLTSRKEPDASGKASEKTVLIEE